MIFKQTMIHSSSRWTDCESFNINIIGYAGLFLCHDAWLNRLGGHCPSVTRDARCRSKRANGLPDSFCRPQRRGEYRPDTAR